MPCSGPSAAPLMSAASAVRAAFIAPSASSQAKALIFGSTLSIRASTACINSTGERRFCRIIGARTEAGW